MLVFIPSLIMMMTMVSPAKHQFCVITSKSRMPAAKPPSRISPLRLMKSNSFFCCSFTNEFFTSRACHLRKARQGLGEFRKASLNNVTFSGKRSWSEGRGVCGFLVVSWLELNLILRGQKGESFVFVSSIVECKPETWSVLK